MQEGKILIEGKDCPKLSGEEWILLQEIVLEIRERLNIQTEISRFNISYALKKDTPFESDIRLTPLEKKLKKFNY
jgi:hypothetical protein